jgi:radical SAM superfamily enzyme YgiQ (UPF0313 family)
MKLKCLLINPWVYDFAAMNLWSRPLGLIKVAEYMSRFNVKLRLIDCTDVFTAKEYGKGKYPYEVVDTPEALRPLSRRFKRYGISIEEFRRRLGSADLLFVTSIMSYWYPGVVKAIEVAKSEALDIPVFLGGIYATLYPEHAAKHSGADFIYRGPVGYGLRAALNTFGFRLKEKHAPKPYYMLKLYEQYPFAPLLTSRGCPYDCSYCASKALSGEFSQRAPEEVVSEIKDLYGIGVRDYAFYDDALLLNADTHLKPVLKEVRGRFPGVRFHCPNGLHARHMDQELARLMKLAGFRTLRLSLETVNTERLATTGGKVRADELERAVLALKKQGFGKEHIGVYLMYGLPGQPLEEVKEGVQFIKGLGVMVKLTEFSPIPGTRCWDELRDRGVIRDDIDPLLTNNTAFAALYSGYDPDELDALKLKVKAYNTEI